MKSYFKSLNLFFNIFIILFFLFEIVLSADVELCESDSNCRSVLIYGKIIFITSSDSQPYIYCFDDNASNHSIYKGNYNSGIQRKKNILKVEENEILIYGFTINGDKAIFYAQRFSINENNGNLLFSKEGDLIDEDFSISSNYFRQNSFIFNVKVIDNEKKIIISTIIDYTFLITRIDLVSRQKTVISINDENEGLPEDTKSNIQCDSLDAINFHCVLSYSDSNSIYYINRNFDDSNSKKFMSIIDSTGCLNANIEAIGSDKYLVCYQKMLSNSNLYSIYCQYYLYSSGELNFGKNHEFMHVVSYTIGKNPLILYKFDNSIFIEYDCLSDTTKSQHIIITTLDFSLNYQFQIPTSSNEESFIPTINFYNDKNNYYIIYESGQRSLIKNYSLVTCQDFGEIYLSESNQTVQINFIDKHEKLDIGFLINEKIQLEPLRDKYLSTDTDKRFIFNRKGSNSGFFDNYYFYSNSSNAFSLICQLNITSCYPTCDKCVYGKEGNSAENFCTECLPNYISKTDDNNDIFNCYFKDEIIDGYYRNSQTGKFEKCNDTCTNCKDASSCQVCKDKYYFKFENNKLNQTTICFNGDLEYYYLSTNRHILNSYNNEFVDNVYERCFHSCHFCLGKGTYDNNNCLNCSAPYIQYDFNRRQCLIDHNDVCFKNDQYWKIENNNITCHKDCDFNIILDEKNMGQCVKNCNDFFNPHLDTTMFFTLINCNNKNYCIPFDVCNNGHFIINYENKTCISKTKCNIDIFDKETYIHYYEPIIETTILETIPSYIPLTPDDIKNRIEAGIKVFKIIPKENDNYTNYDISDNSLIAEYINILDKEYEQYEGDRSSGIYLAILKKYFDFNITIYPIDIESFAYENVFLPNNLGFINLANYFTENNTLYYESITNQILLAIILERKSLNSSINELNYYFYGMNRNQNQKGEFLNISNLNLVSIEDKQLQIMYPLKSYYNQNSSLKKRNSEYLVENLRTFNLKDPEIELYNINDPFFNDICYQFSSEIDTDMTLDDRRKEYYVNKSLCEDNCYLEQLQINENNIKSVCSCKFKKEFSLNKNAGILDEIPSISKMNAKAILCIERTFKAENVAKNPIFWVFVILIIFLIVMLLAYIFYGNGVLKRILHLGTAENNSENSQIESDNNEQKENNNNVNSFESDKKFKINSDEDEISDHKKLNKKNSLASSKSNEINKLIINNNKKNKKINNNINNNNKNMSPKNSSIYDYNNENNNNNNKDSFNKNKSIPIDSASSNNDKVNPPKKVLNKEESITTKAGGEEKDLLSNDPSLIKKYQSSEISYESINGEKPILIDNLLENGVEMENNYINYPKEYEKKLIFNLIRGAIYQTEENEEDNFEEKQKYNSDIFEHNYNPEVRDNYKKKLKEKSKLVTKLLEGEDLFKDKDSNKGYISDNVEENKYDKYKKGYKKSEIDENEYFPNISENILSNYKNTLKAKNNKNKRYSKKEEDKSNDTNNLINDDTSKDNTKKDNILTISETIKVDRNEERNKKYRKHLRRSDLDINKEENNDENNEEQNKEEVYGKNESSNKEKIITEANKEEDNKKKIKETLRKKDNDGFESREESNSSSIQKNRSFISIDSGKGMIKNESKNKLKSGNKKNVNKINFQEEEEKNGDNAFPQDKKKKKKLNNLKENLKKKSIKNKKIEKNEKYDDAIKISLSNEKEKKEEILEKKSDFEIFNEKILGSSVSSFFETTADKKEKKDLNFARFYWKYFKNRELILVSFIDTKDTIPYFIRWSCFVFCLFFLFMLNCLFLLESTIHDKYENIKNGGDDMKYYFKHQFVFSIYVALIYIVFKMIIIKLVLNRALKIKKDAKRMMEHSYEKELTQVDLANLKEKRVDYLVNYHTRIIIYFVALFILSLFIAYICVCYSEVFKNSVTSILLGFVFSLIFSFIFCAVICLIIITFYKVGKKFRNKCLLSTSVVFSTMY